LRFPDLSFFFEYSRYSPDLSFLIMSISNLVKGSGCKRRSDLRHGALLAFGISSGYNCSLSYDLCLPVELELYFGVDDRLGPGPAQDRSAAFG